MSWFDDRVLTGAQVARESGLSYKKVDRWAREGILVPSLDPGQGSGSVRHYSTNDLRLAKVLAALNTAGMKYDWLRPVAQWLCGESEQYSPHGLHYYWWTYRWLIIDDSRTISLHTDASLDAEVLREEFSGTSWLIDLNVVIG